MRYGNILFNLGTLEKSFEHLDLMQNSEHIILVNIIKRHDIRMHLSLELFDPNQIFDEAHPLLH